MPAPRPSITPSTSASTATGTKRRASSSSVQPNKHQSLQTTQTTTHKISKRMRDRGVWTEEEHDKFLVGIKLFPKGPWKAIADQVGSRSARQVQTHAQKYYEKVARRLRGLRKDRKKLVRPEHRLDDDMMSLCKVAEVDMSGARVAIGPIGCGWDVLSPLLDAETSIEDLNPFLLSPVVALKPIDKLQVFSPMGVSDVKFHHDNDSNGIEDFELELQNECIAAQSFMSLLAEPDSQYYNYNHCVDLDDACSTTSTDDTSSSACSSEMTSDDTESLMDFNDCELDYLMDVLVGNESSSCETESVFFDDRLMERSASASRSSDATQPKASC